MTAYPYVTVEAAFPSNPLDATPSYTTLLSADGRSRLVNCPSLNRQIGSAGTMTLILDNSDGALNPWNTASQYYGNLLSENQSSLETAITGWVPVTNCSVSRTTASSLNGSASMLMSSTAAGDMEAGTSATVPVVGGSTYTAFAWFKRNAPQRNVRVRIGWWNGGTFLSYSNGTYLLEDPGTPYVQATATAAAPSNANGATVVTAVQGTTGAGEQHYVDAISLHGGTDLNFYLGGRGGNIQPMVKVRVRAQWNLLTANQADVETDTTGWGNAGNATVTRTTARALSGAASLSLVAIANGDMSASTFPVQSDVFAGQQYSAMAFFSRNGPQRSCKVTIDWYNSGGGLISSSPSGTVLESAGTDYVFAGVTATAPTGAVKANVVITVLSAGIGEQHYVDAVGLFPAPGIQTWSAGGPQYLFTGYVEEWGAEWEDVNFGDMAVSVVDAHKVTTLVKPAKADYSNAVLADSPIGYFRLDDSGVASAVNGLITAEDSSGNNRDAIYKGSPEFEQNSALPSEPGAAVGFKRGDKTTVSGSSEVGAYLDLPISVSPATGTGNWSVEMWVRPKSIRQGAFTSTNPADRIWQLAAVGSQIVVWSIQADGKLLFSASDGANGGSVASSVALTVGRWNHVVAVKSGTTGPANWKLYINGADVSTSASTTGTGNISITTNSGLVGGYEASGVGQGALDGDVDEVAIYNSALSSARVTAHYNAGYGLVAEALTGTRLGELLDLIGFPAGDRTLDAGQFLMQPVTEPLYDTPIFGLIERLIESEGWPAAWFFSGRGWAVFQDRAHSTPASSATFSDASATLYYDKGPGPVRSDRIGLWPAVVVQADNGKPSAVRDATSAARYIERTLTRTGLKNASAADVDTMAAAELARTKDPRDRLERLVIHPIDEPGTMWPQVLGRELNDVITVERTDNPGHGSAFLGNFRISGIGHTFDGQDWFCTWQLEPA